MKQEGCFGHYTFGRLEMNVLGIGPRYNLKKIAKINKSLPINFLFSASYTKKKKNWVAYVSDKLL